MITLLVVSRSSNNVCNSFRHESVKLSELPLIHRHVLEGGTKDQAVIDCAAVNTQNLDEVSVLTAEGAEGMRDMRPHLIWKDWSNSFGGIQPRRSNHESGPMTRYYYRA